MSEQKLKKVFNLPKNLYISGSPIIISYGGLFKDESGDRVFVSLGLKDVKAKEISSFKVSIQGYDNIWKPLGKAVEFTFDDPDGENLMELSNPDKALYAINAVVSHVIFSDGSSWENSENQWVPMKESDVADGGIFNPRVVEERRRQFAEKMNAI